MNSPLTESMLEYLLIAAISWIPLDLCPVAQTVMDFQCVRQLNVLVNRRQPTTHTTSIRNDGGNKGSQPRQQQFIFETSNSAQQ